MNLPSDFVTTRWTQVLLARGGSAEAKVALSQLCETCWKPVFRFIRGCNYPEDIARDLTQEFFTQLLTHDGLDLVEPGKGRFRSYLLGAVKHFLSDQLDKAKALKRGGGQEPLPISSEGESHSTGTLQIPDPQTPVSDAYFDRQWALNLVERALSALQEEFRSAGKVHHYETLKPWLIGDISSTTQNDAARQLGLTDGAVKVSIHRLRKRFRELVKAEVAGTIEQAVPVQEELNYLLEALAQN